MSRVFFAGRRGFNRAGDLFPFGGMGHASDLTQAVNIVGGERVEANLCAAVMR